MQEQVAVELRSLCALPPRTRGPGNALVAEKRKDCPSRRRGVQHHLGRMYSTAGARKHCGRHEPYPQPHLRRCKRGLAQRRHRLPRGAERPGSLRFGRRRNHWLLLLLLNCRSLPGRLQGAFLAGGLFGRRLLVRRCGALQRLQLRLEALVLCKKSIQTLLLLTDDGMHLPQLLLQLLLHLRCTQLALVLRQQILKVDASTFEGGKDFAMQRGQFEVLAQKSG
mmetsp:Transcript_12655/g.23842  ORF Transcript_12655/g.23842 Transcript_12655/m.23842 type:complete len:223 (-) Transcript_12655:172-840(-)